MSKLMGNKKLLAIVVVLLLVILGLAFKLLTGGSEAGPKPKVAGHLVDMQDEFLLNLREGRYAKFKVALLLGHDDPLVAEMAAAGGGHGGGTEVPHHPQEALLRAIITDEVVGSPASRLLERSERKRLLEDIAHQIEKKTDAHVERVYITNLTVD